MSRGGRRSGMLQRDGGAHGSFGTPGALQAFSNTLVSGSAAVDMFAALAAGGSTQVTGTAALDKLVALAASGLTQVTGAASPDSYQNILGANLIALWHQGFGVSLDVNGEVSGWTDAIGGRQVTPPNGVGVGNRPAYAADGANFRGKPVVQCFISGNRGLRGNFAAFTSAGTRPWIFTVTRMRSIAATAGIKRVVDFGQTGFGNNLLTFYRNASPDWGADANGGSLIAFAATTDTAQHRWEAGFDPNTLNVLYFSLDAGAHVTAGAGTVAAMTNVGVGEACFTSGEFSDSNHALIALCAAYPTLPQIAALHALAVADFG